MGEAQYRADKEFTTVDSRVWDRLPGVQSPVLLLDGSLVRGRCRGQQGRGVDGSQPRAPRATAPRPPHSLPRTWVAHSLAVRPPACPQDTPVPPINAVLIAEQLPDARVAYFDGWGHGLVVGEAGARLAAMTADFLAGREPEASFVVPKVASAAAAPAPSATPGAPASAAASAGAAAAALAVLLGAAALLA